MLRGLIPFVLFVTILSACSPYKTITSKSDSGDIKIEYSVLKKDPEKKSGPWTYYLEGKKHTEGHYTNDVKTGKWKYYNGNEELAFEGSFKNGEYHGQWVYYPSSYHTRSELFYNQGKKDSVLTFHKNGKLALHRNYDGLYSTMKTFYENGNLEKEERFWDSKKDGDFKRYTPEGKLISHVKYDKGKPVQVFLMTDNNGKPLQVTPFENGTGVLYDFYYDKEGSTGNLHSRTTYKNGLEEGLYEIFYKDGTLRRKGHYSEGKAIGWWYNYTKDGAIKDSADASLKTDMSLIYQADYDKDIFTIVELMPAFVGGEKGLINYLSKTIKYPTLAKDAGITDVVYVTFVINEIGGVEEARILKGHNAFHDVVLNLTNNMPRWNPGMQRGIPVKVQYNLPLRFTLK